MQGPRLRDIPCLRSGEAKRSYPTSKVWSSGCSLLELQRDNPMTKVRETQVRGLGAERASEGRQTDTTITVNWPIWSQNHSLVELNEIKSCHVGPPKRDGSWWRGLTECGPMEKGTANHFSSLALRTPCTLWKGKKTGHWKMDREAWHPTVHGVTKSWTQLSDWSELKVTNTADFSNVPS